MSHRKAKKATNKKSNASAAAAKRALKEAEHEEVVQWLERNDPLYERSRVPPITISELLSEKLSHRTFTMNDKGEVPYDWSKLRAALEGRNPKSPRWFMQLREEDLLFEDVLDGVTVDCVVIAEASVPTLAPAHYIVKMHMPFSDPEDNAPECILPIEGQGMCWRSVVRDNNCDINAYLLQKRETKLYKNYGFSFGDLEAFGTTVPASNTSIPTFTGGFGFGATPASYSNVPPSFGFGASTNEKGFSLSPNTASFDEFGSKSPLKATPLKTSEVLFALWSKKRLSDMARSLKSGSRILRENFKPSPSASEIRLVMQNDFKDDVSKTVKQLILNKIFAKRSDEVMGVDQWIEKCPVYDEHLTAALQKFRAHYVQKVAEDSDVFKALYNECHESMEKELNRIVELRKAVVQQQLSCIEEIMGQLKEGKMAEKRTFRLLKYYPANDVVRFRPFGKVSGISEMGESADVCEPPAPVLVNPFNTAHSANSP
ncbi:hypothetical protein TcCL_ESM00448 [Trypanosoma cruzi]|uniref:Nucleoporin n=1 Tax=Trypanosoma cruzi (strain CL Brener) TaxID=353153 RepID=Q4E2Q0_TRYCC|nr:hypothetical protein, conserved [Trypanosoma cruzi]EAN99075.1 hypothetical protein, conserved [Trypanosoma cruzi]RNC61836.1 hypothetical protein TcCL_ESM00448 [Trypanosoma cruzi]|eukprot:XP_820926.1 hypothetical protein [Trypanosoma cruzi strain CL Brener]